MYTEKRFAQPTADADNCSACEIETGLEVFGKAMGPYSVADVVGGGEREACAGPSQQQRYYRGSHKQRSRSSLARDSRSCSEGPCCQVAPYVSSATKI